MMASPTVAAGWGAEPWTPLSICRRALLAGHGVEASTAKSTPPDPRRSPGSEVRAFRRRDSWRLPHVSRSGQSGKQKLSEN